MKNGNEMTKTEIEEMAGVKITEREYEHIQDFYCGTGVKEIYQLLLNFRYRLLQFYENRTNDIYEHLKKLARIKT